MWSPSAVLQASLPSFVNGAFPLPDHDAYCRRATPRLSLLASGSLPRQTVLQTQCVRELRVHQVVHLSKVIGPSKVVSHAQRRAGAKVGFEVLHVQTTT